LRRRRLNRLVATRMKWLDEIAGAVAYVLLIVGALVALHLGS
jgi:hypothetical protein